MINPAAHNAQALVHIAGGGLMSSTLRSWFVDQLEKAAIYDHDIEHIKLNKTFAPQSSALIRDLDDIKIDSERVDFTGSAIALGHPLGETGSILTLTSAYAFHHTQGKHGILTMCIGGEQEISQILE